MLSLRLTAGALCGLLACGTSRSGPAETEGTGEQSRAGPAADHCVEARIDALSVVAEIVSHHAMPCSVDGDCMILNTSLPCQENCQGAVVAAQATAFAKELDDYATSICATLPMECGLGPSCAQVTGARCMDGTCLAAVAGMHP